MCSTTRRASTHCHRSQSPAVSRFPVRHGFAQCRSTPWSKFSPPTSTMSRSGLATRSHCAAPPACATRAPGAHHSRRRSCPAFILPDSRHDSIVQHHLYAQHAHRPLSIPGASLTYPLRLHRHRIHVHPLDRCAYRHQRPLQHFDPGLSTIACAALAPSHRARRGENAAAGGQRATQPHDRHAGRAERLRARREQKRSAYSITASAMPLTILSIERFCAPAVWARIIYSSTLHPWSIALCYFPILLLVVTFILFVCKYGNSCALVCYRPCLVHSKNENQSGEIDPKTGRFCLSPVRSTRGPTKATETGRRRRESCKIRRRIIFY
ncbi:hypothetical protein B0H14DRAFT_289856 [Mycena olivaceomarginata]|nr:hypothetical protein B0H14DRAFT_289856 [Mycena olivaceomarginata]